MATHSYEERDGKLYVRCRHCKRFIAQAKLGQHLRTHAPPRNRANASRDKWFSATRNAGTPSKGKQKRAKRRVPRARARPRHKQRKTRRRVPPDNQIRRICESRSISRVIHFTRLENLNRILSEGLLPRATLERRASKKNPFIAVDQNRYDGHTHTISVSISFPNYQMFYKYRKPTGDDRWVVLSLNPALLWELECAFCPDNAASAKILKQRLSSLKQPQALRRMFAESVRTKHGRIHRSDLAIPDHYPTNPQAEVLVCEPIAPYYIFEAAFHNHSQRRRWIRRYGEDPGGVNLVINRGFFRARPGN